SRQAPRGAPACGEAHCRGQPPGSWRDRGMAHALCEGLIKHPPHDTASVEVFLGERAGQAAVALVVGLGLGPRAYGLVDGPEPEEAFGIGQEAAGARVLYHGGLPARQVAGGAVADPPGGEPHVGRFGATELAARVLDVRAVLLRRRAHIPGLPEPPAEGLQARAPRLE